MILCTNNSCVMNDDTNDLGNEFGYRYYHFSSFVYTSIVEKPNDVTIILDDIRFYLNNMVVKGSSIQILIK